MPPRDSSRAAARGPGKAPNQGRAGSGPEPASVRDQPAPVEAAVLALQRDAGNRATAQLIETIQRAPRRRPRGRTRMASGEAILGADAINAMLHGEAGAERLGDVPSQARFAMNLLLDAMRGVSPSGRRGFAASDRVVLLDRLAPKLEVVLDAALREAGGELDQATRARKRLAAIRTAWVRSSAGESVAEDTRAVEFHSPKGRAQRMKLAEAAKLGIEIYVRGEKFIGLTDPPGLSKDLRASRLTVLEGMLALANTSDWPSWGQSVAAVDAQLARTDPDRMLGAGAAVLDQIKKATSFVTASAELLGTGMRSLLVARGMMKEAAVLSKSLEGIGTFSKALVVLDVVANVMVLLDGEAAGSKKLGAGIGLASGASSVASSVGTALGAEGAAAMAGTAGTVLFGAAVTYESYKALAEYGYTSVVGGLSYVAVDEELEGEHVIRKRGRTRLGGLEPLGRAVSTSRTRVEALERRLQAASARDREGVALALNDEVRRLQNALHALRRRWASSPQDAIRARLPAEDELAWRNAMTPEAEPFMVLSIAEEWEGALAMAFASKEAIVNETMHSSMKRR